MLVFFYLFVLYSAFSFFLLKIKTFFFHQHEMVAVDYYAPWCSWCRNLEPVWEKVAGDLLAEPWGDVARLAKVGVEWSAPRMRLEKTTIIEVQCCLSCFVK